MNLFAIVAVMGFFGVAIGAFGAHALGDTISPKLLAAYRTGVEYHFYHVLAALAVLLLRQQLGGGILLSAACICFLIGIVLFSGSLYAMAVFNKPMLGIITPFGGLSFLVAWSLLAIAMIKA